MKQANIKRFITKEEKIGRPIRINQEIKASKLRVIGQSGEQLGIMTLTEAMVLAEEAGVDLVEISPDADPPVVKIVDWGKYQYQKMKEQHKNKQHNKTSELKQIRIGLKIAVNDLEIKLRKIRKFLDEGHKVKICVMFKGREMAHQAIGFDLINRIIDLLSEDATVEQPPQLAGKNLSITVTRSK